MPSQDVWKFTPVSYRTSALWGRCPALTPLLQLITASRASGTADHVRSLDDLLCMFVGKGYWGVDGGWKPLPTRPQQYCDPASLVLKLTCSYPWQTWFERACKKQNQKSHFCTKLRGESIFGGFKVLQGALKNAPNTCWRGLISKRSAEVPPNRKKEYSSI